MTAPHTFAVLEPGHFHAALMFKRANPRVDPHLHLYAAPGAERDAFVALIEAFNTRADAPTAWRLEVHEADDPLARLMADGHADNVILAGRNASKLEAIAALHGAGLGVLADKPWLTSPGALAYLQAVTAGPPLAMDIMTERHELLARVRAAVVADTALFGTLATDDPDGPAIEIGSKHHLFKRVNGEPLRRPAWYYDVGVQGDGLIDIQSHMTDQMQWLVGEARPWDLDADVTELTATRWGTPVPLALFTASTGETAFPATLADRITDGVLDLQCNSEIRYRLRGVPVCQRAEWDQREPDGSGDLHTARLRGTRAELLFEHGPHTGFVGQWHLRPRPGVDLAAPLADALQRWRADFPGIDAAPSEHGQQLLIPDAIRTTHEGNFGSVLDEYLDLRESGRWPAELGARIRMRYGLLARARALVDGAA